MVTKAQFDYIIVGAGAAGCVLANRLSEDPGARVLLLEAGGWDRDRWIHIPLGVGRIQQRRLHDWGYSARPEASAGGRSIALPRGKVIGGCTSIHTMTYVRGNRGDYDRWAASGLADWSYDRVLPYFKRTERWEGGADAYRGGSGPVWTRRSRYDDPLVEACLEAAARLGHPRTDDYNGARQEGFALLQSMIHAGRRVSAATAYLRPALRRPNLQVKVGALATRILLEGRNDSVRAAGVEYLHGSSKARACAAAEVILAAGAYSSPRLLMLSGVGDPSELATHAIPVQAAVPGVGKNLQDHCAAALTCARRGSGPLVRNLRLDRIALALARAQLFGTGFAAELPGRWTAFLKLNSGAPVPDMQLLFRAGPADARPWLPPFSRPAADQFTFRAVLLHPESRGTVSLASADPLAAPVIRHNYLAAETDRATLRGALRLARGLARQAVLQPFVERELAPGAERTSDALLDEYIRATAATANHPAGTCRMGPAGDSLAVVDEELRVRGVAGLRVADASVMPDLVSGNINAAVYMIAEKAAALIRPSGSGD